jgi:hypothetical protein
MKRAILIFIAPALGVSWTITEALQADAGQET